MNKYDLLIDCFYVLALVALSIGGIPQQCSFEYDLAQLLPSQEVVYSGAAGWKAGFGLASGPKEGGAEVGWTAAAPVVPVEANAMPPPEI